MEKSIERMKEKANRLQHLKLEEQRKDQILHRYTGSYGVRLSPKEMSGQYKRMDEYQLELLLERRMLYRRQIKAALKI